MTRTKQITAGLIAGVSLAAFGAAPLSAEHFTKLSPFHTMYGVSQFNYADVGVDNSVYLLNPNHVTQVAAVLAYNHAAALFVPRCIAAIPAPCVVSNGPVSNGLCSLGTGGILFFSSGEVSVGEQPEEFLACVVVLLTPHESLQVTTPFFQAFSYVETIWSPVQPVRVLIGDDRKARRLADGLGGRTYTQAEDDGAQDVPGNDYLAHPGLFTLPRDDFDYLFDEFFWIQPNDQRQAAIDCICAGVFNLRFNPFNTEVSLKVFKPFGINCPPPPIRVLLD